VARKRVKDGETAIKQEQQEICNAENPRLTTRESEKSLQEMMIAIGDSLSNLTGSDDEPDGGDDDNSDSECGKLGEDDTPSWVVDTISKTVQQCMERLWQKSKQLDKITQVGSSDTANYIGERDSRYSNTDLTSLAVVHPQAEQVGATPTLTTFGAQMVSLDSIKRKLPMSQVTP
jgi:hypothetical protein